VRSRLNLVFMLLSFYCLMPYISMGLYASDKKFYLADASSQLYRPLAYYFAKVGAGATAAVRVSLGLSLLPLCLACGASWPTKHAAVRRACAGCLPRRRL
jgi:hypothetical protein